MSHLLPPSRPTHRGLRREPLPLPTPEEEANLSSSCCHGDRFTSVHMLGTCVCPAPHVSAHPHPHGPRHGGEGATGSAGRGGGGQGAAGDSLTVAAGRGVGSWLRCLCAEGRRLPDWPGACARACGGGCGVATAHSGWCVCRELLGEKYPRGLCARARRGGCVVSVRPRVPAVGVEWVTRHAHACVRASCMYWCRVACKYARAIKEPLRGPVSYLSLCLHWERRACVCVCVCQGAV